MALEPLMNVFIDTNIFLEFFLISSSGDVEELSKLVKLVEMEIIVL